VIRLKEPYWLISITGCFTMWLLLPASCLAKSRRVPNH